MAQTLTTSFIQTSVPGAYNEVIVKSEPVGVASSGIIAIIGEADGGDSFSSEEIKQNYFAPSQLDSVSRKYVSGNIVDAFRMLSSSSSDADITGAPTRIYILKTNNSTKASSAIASSYGSISAKVAGADGNKNKYEITQIDEEIAPQVSGDSISNFAALAGVEFGVRLNGGALQSLDLFTGLPDDYDDISEVIALIDSALPAGMSCVAGEASDSVKIMVNPDSSAHAKGWGKSLELVEITAGGLAALGLEEGLYTSAIEPKIQWDIKRSDINLNESFNVSSEIAMDIGYEGTTATVTVTSSHLITSVTGGAGANLNIQLSQFNTIKDLADFISSQTGYSAQAQVGSTQLNPSALDKVSAIGICSSIGEKAGRIKKCVHNAKRAISGSQAVDLQVSASQGLPDETSSPVFLVGGAKGSTSASDVVAAIDKLEGIDVNFIVPLFSRDASEDIAEGLTESSSAYTISAINAAVKNHVLKMSTSKLKKNRTAYLSIWSDYQSVKAEVSSLSHYRVSLCFQKASQVNSVGEIQKYLPWMSAICASGMQAAGFYRSILNKFANVISFEDPAGYDSGNPADQEDALLAGLLPLSQDIVGNKWLSDQTSYALDTNFVYNSSQLVYLSDLVSLDLTASLQRAFVGKSLADVDSSTVVGFIVSKMDQYKKQKLIAASDDAPTGFKNLKVAIRGPVCEVAIEIKPSGSIYFIPISISLSQVTSESEA
jgi:hypothetical protein